MKVEKFNAKMDALERVVPREMVAPALLGIVEDWGMYLETFAPEDTRRFRRGWALSLRDVGITAMALKPLRKAKFADNITERLEKQVAWAERQHLKARGFYLFWSRIYNTRYADQNRKGKWERDCRLKRNKAGTRLNYTEKVLSRARENLRFWQGGGEESGALIIFGRGRKTLANGKKDPDLKLSNLIRVITKVYGGEGRAVIGGGGRVEIKLHNMEPHTSIVESRKKVLRAARDFARAGAGVKTKVRTRRGLASAAEKSGLKVG